MNCSPTSATGSPPGRPRRGGVPPPPAAGRNTPPPARGGGIPPPPRLAGGDPVADVGEQFKHTTALFGADDRETGCPDLSEGYGACFSAVSYLADQCRS
ncbi:hypothetical protein, partial [Brevundimonas sp.]|uniref:hypothetical protein n=1 Tax=Brevundimonas sp. TaxID=1871086 RepID=UPI00391A632A